MLVSVLAFIPVLVIDVIRLNARVHISTHMPALTHIQTHTDTHTHLCKPKIQPGMVSAGGGKALLLVCGFV